MENTDIFVFKLLIVTLILEILSLKNVNSLPQFVCVGVKAFKKRKTAVVAPVF